MRRSVGSGARSRSARRDGHGPTARRATSSSLRVWSSRSSLFMGEQQTPQGQAGEGNIRPIASSNARPVLPATAGDPMGDTRGRRALAGFGWPREHVEEIMLYETLRGVTDYELRRLELRSVVTTHRTCSTQRTKSTRSTGLSISSRSPYSATPFPRPQTSLPAPTSAFVAELQNILAKLSTWPGGSRCT
jgi:hypothetical protein